MKNVRRFTMKRTMAFVAVVAVAAGLAATSQAHTTGAAHPAGRADLQLTYTKWFAPSFPNMVGVVGGDISGQFGGAVLHLAPTDSSGHFVQITAVYIVVAADPSRSFTAHVEGVQDNATQTAVLDGRVVDGQLKGAHVHAEYKVISCTEAPNGTCFQGTITVGREDSPD
jgi:hypothetical protein